MSEQQSLGREIKTSIQILVEGRTPEIFFREMVEKHLNLKDKIQVRDFKNIENLTTFLRIFTRRPEFIEKVTSLGIIRDAEDKPATSAFQSVCNSLETVGITRPNKIGEVQNRTFDLPDVIGDTPTREIKTGVFILPDCNDKGMIETLCLQSLTEDKTQEISLKCVDEYFECLRKNNGVSPENIEKAKTWTFLSAHGSFDPQVGRAAQKKIWNWGGQTFQPLVDFLRDLYVEE